MTRRAFAAGMAVLLIATVALGDWSAPRRLDEARLARAGLRIVESRYATLVTDAAPAPEIDGLPELIDLAVPQWAERFEPADPDWRLRVYLIEDEVRFRALGLWPDKSPDFPHGLSLGYEVWLRQQASDYYRRHLLLHEGTHSYMSTVLGSCGPGWYMEGTAELCGTHAWDGERLTLAAMPPSREAAPDWGRVRLIRDAVAAGRLLSIDAVRKIDNRVVLDVESYAWVWALCWFLDNHPDYSAAFRSMPAEVANARFDALLLGRVAGALPQGSPREAGTRRPGASASQSAPATLDRLQQEWRLFVSTLAYGHDLRREAIDFSRTASAEDASVRIAADRGWQSTGIRVRANQPIRIDARGRYQIGAEPDGAPWPCEPGGITLAYHAGRPLGELLATIDAGPGAFVAWTPIGLGAEYTPPATGTLYLRVNDSPAGLSDNRGEAVLRITP